jgi:hypothetical protein
MRMSNDIFSGPWVVEYYEGTSDVLTKRHITAAYKFYGVGRIAEILKEIHPDWNIQKIYKVEKLPWKD